MSVINPPTAKFKSLVRALESGRTLDGGSVQVTLSADCVQWLHRASVRFAAGNEAYLCSALGLRGAGLDTPARTYERERRNYHLSLAFEHVEGTSPYDRCKRLGKTIKHFRFHAWPRVSQESEPPDRLTDCQKHLFAAFQCYNTVPSSASHLSSILL